MSIDDFDQFVSQLDTALVVVTTASNEQRAGCVVGFHTQCSIEPQRYAVWLSKANLTYRVVLFATHIALHLLPRADQSLLQLFGGTSGDRTDKFALSRWTPGPGGVPLLTDCPARAVLEITSRWDDGSDHACIVGRPIAAGWADVTPMRLSDAGDTDAGHDAEERSVPRRLDAADSSS
jgi:flavin reductase (DIM6/NTAB) family NADH-FMN oxidoreductase RutF